MLFRLGDLGYNDHNDRDGNEDEQDDKQAPPLLAVAATGLLNGAPDLRVGLYNVLVDFLALLLDVGNERLLLLNDLVEILEELSKLDHLALDVLNGFVSLLDVAEGRGGLTTAVRVEKLRN